ncbi:polyprenyl synthetase family protein [Streptomyces sp. NPDC001774]
MNPSPFLPDGLSLADDPAGLSAVQERAYAVLARFLELKADSQPGWPAAVTRALRSLALTGERHLQPAMCVLGWQAAGGRGPAGPVVCAAASLEMFRAFCLIHTGAAGVSAGRRMPVGRRSAPASVGQPRPGTSGPLLGDLALAWSDELLHTGGLTPRQAASASHVIDRMHDEVLYGQYLSALYADDSHPDPGTLLRIMRYRTAKYAFERPLHLGAVLAEGSDDLLDILTGYALPAGEAFQLRSDLLSLYNSPGLNGGADRGALREGKSTVLWALALRRADPAQQRILRRAEGTGEPGQAGAVQVRRVLDATGARRITEALIQQRRREALRALHGALLPPAVHTALGRIAGPAAPMDA